MDKKIWGSFCSRHHSEVFLNELACLKCPLYSSHNRQRLWKAIMRLWLASAKFVEAISGYWMKPDLSVDIVQENVSDPQFWASSSDLLEIRKGTWFYVNSNTSKRIHSGKRPQRCTQYNYSASQLVSLRNHISKHTGEKTHHCNQCEY